MKIAVRVVLAILAIVLVCALGLLSYRGWLQHRIRRELKLTTQNHIDEAGFIQINGRQEWITIRGEDRSKPVILFLHGGPAEANSELARLYQPFEHDYVLVQWDQPGAGKTWIRAGDHQPALTLDSMAADGVAVAAYVGRELRQPKVILIGQDWGGVLGLRMAQMRPDLFRAFVGTGQMVGWVGEQADQYAYTKARAAATHDSKTLDVLRKVGPPPYLSLAAYRAFGDAFEAYKPGDDLKAEQQLQAFLFMSPGLSIPELFGWLEALRTGEQTLTPVLMHIDLLRTDPRFSVPIYFIEGADEIICPPRLVAEYLAKIQSPAKRMDLIPGAAHMVMWQHPNEFLKALRQDLSNPPAP